MNFYEDITNLATEVIDKMIELDGEGSVSVVANPDICADLLRELIYIDGIEGYDFTLESIDINRDEDLPYLITLTGDGEIWAQKGIIEYGIHIKLDDDVVFIEPEYYDEFNKVLLNKEAEMIKFVIGEDSSKGLIYSNDGRIAGFHFDDENDDHCCHIMYCSCTPKDVTSIVNMYNEILNILANNNF